jgi:hypothetical protein
LWTQKADDENGTSVSENRQTQGGPYPIHLISFTVAYFTEESLGRLLFIKDIPWLAALRVPHGKYKSAKSPKGRPDHIFNPEAEIPEFSCLEHVPIDLPFRHQKGFTNCGSASSASDSNPNILAPLTYLQNITPPQRHPMDAKVLMLFKPLHGLF